MNFPIVPEYQKDILNTNPENKVPREPFEVPAGAKKGFIIVPAHSPFFVRSLRMFKANGQEMVCGDKGDYRIYRIMGDLTNLTAQSVSCMIEILNTDIRSGYMDYDIVGHFSLFDAAFMKMLIAVINDDRPVWWENIRNKPQWFRPKLHGHSLVYEIVAMKDMVKLVGDILALMEAKDRTPLEVKFEHYLRLVTHWIKTYKTELLLNLQRHEGAYNAHGWNKATSGLDKVDNYPTARGAELLQPRNDRHITPDGIKTIMNAYGFNSSELLAQNKLPVSQFGNTNFIPPSIDGSFEGIGGRSETSGITMESDGSLTFLWNRMDGRIDGLYYSMIQTPYNNPDCLYTSYRYSHQRFIADGTDPRLIVDGSGDEVIMVGDDVKQRYYIGVTNGTMDPSKHVYSEINLNAMRDSIGQPTANMGNWLNRMCIMRMGNWIYITFAHAMKNGVLDPNYSLGMAPFRYFYRVPLSEVQAQRPVTAVLVRVSFTDTDGLAFTNSNYWQWDTPVPQDLNAPGGFYKYYKYYFRFKQSDVALAGYYRSQHSLVAPHPDKPGIYLIKMMSSYWGRWLGGATTPVLQLHVEATYEMNPDTGVMTFMHCTPKTEIDFNTLDDIWNADLMFGLTFYDTQSGMQVLQDGTLVAGGGNYQSFPRTVTIIRAENLRNRYESIRRCWNNDIGAVKQKTLLTENIISPLASSVKMKSMILGNGGDCYIALVNGNTGDSKMYYRQSPGKLAPRANVNNLYIGNVVSRPLTNLVWPVKAEAQQGAAYVTVPSSQLDTYGTDLAEFAFCMGVQQFMLNPNRLGGEWPTTTNPNDIMMKVAHTKRFDPDGTITMTNDATLLYPAAIVELLKNEVSDVAKMRQCPKVVVTVCDPTGGPLTAKFGWLPVMVMVHWAELGTTTRHCTFMSIAPTYSGPANARVVTGFTVLDKIHNGSMNLSAFGLTAQDWPVSMGGATQWTFHGAMRCGYYLNNGIISGFFDSGVSSSGSGDTHQVFGQFVANQSTRRLSLNPNDTYIGATGQGGDSNHRSVTPDNGVSIMYPWPNSTGSAGILFNGNVNKPLLASVYPEVGWSIFAQSSNKVAFQGRAYIMPPGTMDLRNVVPNPANKTFYMYAVLKNGVPTYEITEEKRLESPFQVWIGKIVTGASQILTIERFNVATVNSSRVSEIKRGNSIPATSGLANEEGQLPWLRADELLP